MAGGALYCIPTFRNRRPQRSAKGCAASMILRRAISILLYTLLLPACSDSRDRARNAMKRVDAREMRKDVAKYYKDVFAEHRKTIVLLNQQYWSSSFKELRPERITAYPDGFAFCLESTGNEESGLYIVPLGMDHEPKPTPTASYEKLSEGIFWYCFKP